MPCPFMAKADAASPWDTRMPTGASLRLIGLTPRAARLDRIETEHDQASALTWRTDDHGLLDALTRSILSVTSVSRAWRAKLR